MGTRNSRKKKHRSKGENGRERGNRGKGGGVIRVDREYLELKNKYNCDEDCKESGRTRGRIKNPKEE